MRAIRNLNYASSTKVLLHCRDRFWERGDEHERIVGGASMTDEISRATYYPSDHAAPHKAPVHASPAKAGYRSLYTAYEVAAPKSTQTERAPGPGVLVASYNWGRDARRLGALSPDQRAEAVIKVLVNFHPELANDEIVDDYATMYWDDFRWSRGAFCFMTPGDLISYYHDAREPEGRLFFAGEHCSLDQGWIQGALVASLDAVERLVSG